MAWALHAHSCMHIVIHRPTLVAVTSNVPCPWLGTYHTCSNPADHLDHPDQGHVLTQRRQKERKKERPCAGLSAASGAMHKPHGSVNSQTTTGWQLNSTTSQHGSSLPPGVHTCLLATPPCLGNSCSTGISIRSQCSPQPVLHHLPTNLPLPTHNPAVQQHICSAAVSSNSSASASSQQGHKRRQQPLARQLPPPAAAPSRPACHLTTQMLPYSSSPPPLLLPHPHMLPGLPLVYLTARMLPYSCPFSSCMPACSLSRWLSHPGPAAPPGPVPRCRSKGSDRGCGCRVCAASCSGMVCARDSTAWRFSGVPAGAGTHWHVTWLPLLLVSV